MPKTREKIEVTMTQNRMIVYHHEMEPVDKWEKIYLDIPPGKLDSQSLCVLEIKRSYD